jgi:hypothetical protein
MQRFKRTELIRVNSAVALMNKDGDIVLLGLINNPLGLLEYTKFEELNPVWFVSYALWLASCVGVLMYAMIKRRCNSQ